MPTVDNSIVLNESNESEKAASQYSNRILLLKLKSSVGHVMKSLQNSPFVVQLG